MNNATLGKDAKLHNTNRAGMIRSYRTTPTAAMLLRQILQMMLYGLDSLLDALARPVVRRVIRCVVAIACIAAFLCLIGAVERQSVSVFSAVMIGAGLVGVEILCLRGN